MVGVAACLCHSINDEKSPIDENRVTLISDGSENGNRVTLVSNGSVNGSRDTLISNESENANRVTLIGDSSSYNLPRGHIANWMWITTTVPPEHIVNWMWVTPTVPPESMSMNTYKIPIHATNMIQPPATSPTGTAPCATTRLLHHCVRYLQVLSLSREEEVYTSLLVSYKRLCSTAEGGHQ